jgi:hypothetical protein
LSLYTDSWFDYALLLILTPFNNMHQAFSPISEVKVASILRNSKTCIEMLMLAQPSFLSTIDVIIGLLHPAQSYLLSPRGPSVVLKMNVTF